MKINKKILKNIILLILRFINACFIAGFIFELPMTCYVIYIVTTHQGSHLPIVHIVFISQMHSIFFTYNKILFALWGIVFFSSFFMSELIEELPR